MPCLQRAKVTAMAKAPTCDPACEVTTPVAMPAGSAAQESALSKPKAALRAPPRTSSLDAAQIEAKVQQMHADGLQAKLSVPEIKVFLKSRKLPVGGKKADLLLRLSSALGGTAT